MLIETKDPDGVCDAGQAHSWRHGACASTAAAAAAKGCNELFFLALAMQSLTRKVWGGVMDLLHRKHIRHEEFP